MYTEEKFHLDLDVLENEYDVLDAEDMSILEFLDNEGWNEPNLIRSINPLWLTNELNRLNMENEMFDACSWTPRFKIVMGLIEKVTYCNNPHFKTYDLLKSGNNVWIVMNYVKPTATYELENLDGGCRERSKEYVETKMEKIGEVTSDVLENARKKNLKNFKTK